MKYIKQFYVNDYEGNVINDLNQYKQNKMMSVTSTVGYCQVDIDYYQRVDIAFYFVCID